MSAVVALMFALGGSVAPTITSSSTDSVTSGLTLAHALTADESVTWSIVGGADQAQFSISGSTLEWVANGTQNYASPADADTNNTYIVTVRATNAFSQTTDQTITVTVTAASVRQAMAAGLFGAIYLDTSGTRQSMVPGVYVNER